HAVFLDERKDARLDRRERRMESKHNAAFVLAFDLLFAIRIYPQREQRPVWSSRRLDDKRDVALVRRLIDVFETLARILLMPAQIEVAAVVNAFDFLEAE